MLKQVPCITLRQTMSSTRIPLSSHLHNNPPNNAATSHSKSHVLAGVQDAYWSDDEAVRFSSSLVLPPTHLSSLLGGRRLPSLLGGNGSFRHQFQTLPLRLSGVSCYFSLPRSFSYTSQPLDLSVLLASHQRKLEWKMPCLPSGIH